MTDVNDFQKFQRVCLDVLSQSNNCAESQQLFGSAESIPEMVGAWQKFWAGMIHEVPEQVIKVFTEFYPVYREKIRLGGLYYDEAPVLTLSSPMASCMVLVGDGDEPLEVSGRHRVYIIGARPVICRGNCKVYVCADRAQVDIYDNCRCNAEAGRVTAYGRSYLNGKGTLACHDSSTVYIVGGTLSDYGHLRIDAYNDAKVDSFTSRCITLHNQAELTIRSNE